VGYPLHVLDLGGEPKLGRSFGSEKGALRPTAPHLIRRVLWASSAGGVWSGRRYEYVLERFGPTGERKRALRRKTDWFRGVVPPSLGQPDAPPPPKLVTLCEDGRGRVWTFTWRAAADWAEAWKKLGDVRPGMEIRGPPELDKLYDTMVEVIDPQRGVVLLSERWPGIVLRALGHGTVASLAQDELGVPYVDIWRVTLRNVGSGGKEVNRARVLGSAGALPHGVDLGCTAVRCRTRSEGLR